MDADSVIGVTVLHWGSRVTRPRVGCKVTTLQVYVPFIEDSASPKAGIGDGKAWSGNVTQDGVELAIQAFAKGVCNGFDGWWQGMKDPPRSGVEL